MRGSGGNAKGVNASEQDAGDRGQSLVPFKQKLGGRGEGNRYTKNSELPVNWAVTWLNCNPNHPNPLRIDMMNLIFYTKPGCHLCEGLQEKLAQITAFPLSLEMRDITTDEGWFNRYQYEIPVLALRQGDQELVLPRFSPRSPVATIEKTLEQYLH